MKTMLALSALLASALAAAQTAAPPEPEKKSKPLNLKLDDAPRGAAPRIQFDKGDEKAATNSLPGLGAGARSMERQSTRSSDNASPYPKDTNPGMR